MAKCDFWSFHCGDERGKRRGSAVFITFTAISVCAATSGMLQAATSSQQAPASAAQ